MNTPFSSHIFHRDGLAVTLHPDPVSVHVYPKPGIDLPDGFSFCMMQEENRQVFVVSVEERKVLSDVPHSRVLQAKWKQDYPLHKSHRDALQKWRRDALHQPFVSMDLESDGSRMWQIALVPSDDTEPYIVLKGEINAAEVQHHLDRLLPGRILCGHNIRHWDQTVLERHGIHIAQNTILWDTLEQEVEMCKERFRPSYALQTLHDAETDARNALRLVQNQWLRQHVPEPLANEVWRESDAFFIVPDPQWQCLLPAFDCAPKSWEAIELAYRDLDTRAVERHLGQMEWRVPAPPQGEEAYHLFNPASPKRIDYWHRLLPAIEAAHRGSRKTVLFVQLEQEVDCLFALFTDAIKGDPRQGVRKLQKRGGLLILHESQWSRTLAEGFPAGTTVLLEKMPESELIEEIAIQSDQAGELIFNEDEADEDDADAIPNFAELQPERTTEAARRKIPDLPELGKMILWQNRNTLLQFVCLDARLWNKRREAPFKCISMSIAWRTGISRSQVEQAGFRQTTSEFHLPENWEQDICHWFGIYALHPFQRASLARILPRDGLSFQYVERATGGGKSLIFQAAALYRGNTTGRMTVVISPLRALIHDQVDKLHKYFPLDVEALSGDMNRLDIEEAYRRIAGGETRLVYTAPERFSSKGFLRALETRISLDAGSQPEYWVFDEAHCLSLWGLEFRPDYRKAAAYIRKNREQAPGLSAPVLLVSATLTRLAKDDIETVLGVK